MLVLVALLFVVFPIYAQSRAPSPEWKSAVPGNFGAIKAGDLVWKAPHIHTMPHSCKNEPDRVYGKLNGVYYACIRGKEVCSDEKRAIPGGMIADFDAAMREHTARMKEYRAERLGLGRTVSATANHGAGASSAQLIAGGPPAPPSPPPPAPIADELLKDLGMGTSRAEVIAKIGEPYMKIGGGVDLFTYRLTSGGTANLEFETGKLTQLRIAPAQ